MADGVAQNRYAFWLGSGISIDRMPRLNKLALIILDYLQKRADPADSNCRFHKSLVEIMSLALSTDERAGIDIAKEVKDWPDAAGIADRLTLHYARMLDLSPDGQEDDFLVWDALGVVGVFADPSKDPDVEHLCLAALILEGVASDIASANWDGLVEKAVERLSGGAPTLRVWVRSEDARQAPLKADIYKFHGCAVLAGAYETEYRGKIIARQTQINGWAARAENAVIVAKLTELVSTRPTLMLGLSVQDSNIQGVFVAAEQRMQWPWPSHPPAYVFSEDALGIDQQGLLRNVYRDTYTPATRQTIYDAALLRAYAKPLLTALWLFVIAAKIGALIEHAPGSLAPADKIALREGVEALRSAVAATSNAVGIETFVNGSLLRSRRIMSLFREGQEPQAATPGYLAVSAIPVQQIAGDPMLSSSGMREFSIALGLLGLMVKSDALTMRAGDPLRAASKSLHVKGAADEVPLYFAANGQSALKLVVNGVVSDDHDAIVVHSHHVPARKTRSPRAERGRVGRLGLREVSIAELLESASAAPDLLQRFREKVAL